MEGAVIAEVKTDEQAFGAAESAAGVAPMQCDEAPAPISFSLTGLWQPCNIVLAENMAIQMQNVVEAQEMSEFYERVTHVAAGPPAAPPPPVSADRKQQSSSSSSSFSSSSRPRERAPPRRRRPPRSPPTMLTCAPAPQVHRCEHDGTREGRGKRRKKFVVEFIKVVDSV